MSWNNFTIAGLHANAVNFVIRGVIISKSKMTIFEKTGRQEEVSLCGVVKFLIRDTREHYINLTVWGSETFIRDYNQKFTIGHVVNVVNSRISSVRNEDSFDPITSSPFRLTLNESIGSIEFYDGDVTDLLSLLNIPLKSTDLALNLCDVSSTPTSDSGELVDLFVVVAKLRPIRNANGNLVRDVVVVDQTVSGMYLSIWNNAWIERSESWNEMSTTLHLINVRFKYSDFHKSNVLITQSRTIIIVDPESERSTSLKEYAQRSNLLFADFDTPEPDLSTIKTVMSIRKIYDLLNDSSTEPIFYCLTYAVITQMDIDGWRPFYGRRCIHCNCQLKLTDVSCDKEDCSIFFAESPLNVHFINYFNIWVKLADHSGTLDRCFLVGDTAERILGCTLTDFLNLTDAERTEIKWKFLLERCSVKLSVKRKTPLRYNSQINIVDCQLADQREVAENIKVY